MPIRKPVVSTFNNAPEENSFNKLQEAVGTAFSMTHKYVVFGIAELGREYEHILQEGDLLTDPFVVFGALSTILAGLIVMFIIFDNMDFTFLKEAMSYDLPLYYTRR